MPRPTKLRKTSSPSPVMNGAATTKTMTPATTTFFRLHQGRFSAVLTAESVTGSKAVQMSLSHK